MKEVGGKRYLLAASDSRQAEETTLQLAEAGDREMRCLTEGAPLRFHQGAAPLQLPPLGVAAYEMAVP